MCHVNDALVAAGKREPGCRNCIVQDDPNDPCYYPKDQSLHGVTLK